MAAPSLPSPVPAPAPTRGRTLAWAAVLVVATVAAYWPALAGRLIWNDADYVTKPVLRSLAGLGQIWTRPGVTEQYYPLLHSAFWLQHRLWGDNPLGYHLVNVALHCGAAVLFALLLRRLAVPGAWLAAFLFALHPVHVESVAWITEQKNTLSLVFYLAAALAYLRFDAGRSRADYLVASGCFALSLLCKTVTATLPAALLVVLWWKRGRLDARRDVAPLLPWLVFGAVTGLFTSWVEQHFLGARGEGFDLSFAGRVLVAGRAFWFYLGQVAWPARLNFIYYRWAVDPASARQWLFPVAALALAAGLWWGRGRSRAPLAVFLLFAGSLFPVLGFVNLYGALYSWVWDHWQYLPDLPPLALAAAVLATGWQRLPSPLRAAGPAAAALLLAGLGALTWRHTAMFHDDIALYRATLERNPAAWMAHNNLANLLSAEPGHETEAVAHYTQALDLRPGIVLARTNLARLLAQLPGGRAAARTHYETALQLEPGNADAHNELASLLAQAGRRDEALAHFTAALALRPGFAIAHNNLANLLSTLPGRRDEAIAHYERALQLDPALAEAHSNLANQLVPAGRRDDALAHYREALRLKPAFPEAHNNLANLLSRGSGHDAEVLAHYTEAIRLRPNYGEAHRNLGNFLLTQPGREGEALAHYEAAVKADAGDTDARVRLAGQLLGQPDREAEAAGHCLVALQQNPNLAMAHYVLAVIQARHGRNAEAIALCQRALQIDPGYAPARDTLARLQAAK